MLGVFGYFYTVLPVYQKSLLDEEIAQKTLQLREQEKQVIALNIEISQKQADVIAKGRQVTAATSIAAAAKNEARGNYVKLRQEYILIALQRTRDCPSPFHNNEPDGQELNRCPSDVQQRLGSTLKDLKPEDLNLYMSIFRKKTADADAEFQNIVAAYRNKKEAAAAALQIAEQRLIEYKAAGAGGIRQPSYFTQSAEINIKFWEASSEQERVRSEAYGLYRKLLFKLTAQVQKEFFSQVST